MLKSARAIYLTGYFTCSETTFRTLLSRAEFDKFRVRKKYKFNDDFLQEWALMWYRLKG